MLNDMQDRCLRGYVEILHAQCVGEPPVLAIDDYCASRVLEIHTEAWLASIEETRRRFPGWEPDASLDGVELRLLQECMATVRPASGTREDVEWPHMFAAMLLRQAEQDRRPNRTTRLTTCAYFAMYFGMLPTEDDEVASAFADGHRTMQEYKQYVAEHSEGILQAVLNDINDEADR